MREPKNDAGKGYRLPELFATGAALLNLDSRNRRSHHCFSISQTQDGRMETGEQTNTLRIFSKEEIKRELWRALPIWFFYLEGIGLLHFMMANVDPAQYHRLGYTSAPFAATVVFPLFWVVSYYLIRIRKSVRIQDRPYYMMIVPSLLVAPAVLIYLWYSLFPGFRMILSDSTLRLLFEYMQLFWIGAFLVHAFVHRGMHKFVTFYVVGFVYGLLLENTGIYMGYFFEADYRHYLGPLPAPFATMMGWCLVFYCCIWVAEYVREHVPWFAKSPLRAAFLTTAVAISLDIQLDPLASLSGVFWQWNTKLPEWFLSVPFCNYAAWFGAFLPFSWAYFYLLERKDLNELQKNWKLFVHVPLIAGIAGGIWLLLMTIFEGGFSGPTWQIIGEFFAHLAPYPT
jgi:Carotenoid biosynthesis protein